MKELEPYVQSAIRAVEANKDASPAESAAINASIVRSLAEAAIDVHARREREWERAHMLAGTAALVWLVLAITLFLVVLLVAVSWAA